jgi:hypothetical protein
VLFMLVDGFPTKLRDDEDNELYITMVHGSKLRLEGKVKNMQ